MKKIAILTAVAFALVLVAAPAAADSPDSLPWTQPTNQSSFWEDYGATTHQEDDWVCDKTNNDDSSGPYVIGDPPSGSEWRLIVVKAGSTVNDLHWNPMSGDSFDHSVQKGWSHVIECSRPTDDPEPTTTTVPEETTTVPEETTTTAPATTTTAPATTTTDPATTVPTTTPTELPDTGINAGSFVVAALVLLMSGGLVLMGIRRAETE